MAATFWTLSYNGAEKTFPEWGFTDPRTSIANQRGHRFTVRVPGAKNLSGAPPIPFEGQVVIQRGRALGEDGNYSGGEIIFQGKQITDRRVASTSPADVLTFGDAFWDLERITFQQVWKVAAESTRYFATLNLFQAFQWPFAPLNVGQQATDILNYAINICGVNLQLGEIDPVTPVAVYPARGIKCLAALGICAKPVPDALMFIDHSTTPPTFHWKLRGNLTAKTLPYSGWVDGKGSVHTSEEPFVGAVSAHESSDITPRPDLICSDVCLQYLMAGWGSFADDVWPPEATGVGPRSIVCPLDLAPGSKEQYVVNSATLDPANLDWWKLKKHELALDTVKNLRLVPNSITICDEAGNATAYPAQAGPLDTLPNEYLKGEIMTWMLDSEGDPLQVQHVTISAKFTYNELDASGRVVRRVDSANGHDISVRVQITNSPVGDALYSRVLAPMETPPTITVGDEVWGLARYIWAGLQWLQHEGQHTIIERDARLAPAVGLVWGPQYLLNLMGGAEEWTDMRATVQTVDIDWFRGRTSLSFGPAAHLAPGELYELLELWRRRLVMDYGSQRVAGSAGGNSGQMGGATAQENTTSGNQPVSLHTTQAPVPGSASPALQVQHDSAGGELRLRAVDNSDSLCGGYPAVVLKLSDLQHANNPSQEPIP